MIALETSALRDFTTWPNATLHETPGGPTVGFLMRRLTAAKPVHLLYNPSDRQQHFPASSWRELAGAARNLAAAFDAVHEVGLVIGDVNESNIFVTENARVHLIDCDSFQFADARRSYLCDVFTDRFTAPELQSADLSATPRTANHDNFGLAVLIFQLLFLGRQPFEGRYLDSQDVPTANAIAEFRYAYGINAGARRVAPPPQAPPVEFVPEPIRAMYT